MACLQQGTLTFAEKPLHCFYKRLDFIMFRVLITGGHPGFRQAVRDLLRGQFPRIEVSEATDGQQALERLDDLDLLFLDISLPKENGLEFAAKIKSEHPELAVGILTMHDGPEYRQAAFQRGADYFVSKGAPAEQILEVVQSAIARGRTRSAALSCC
jgi:two-component system, NarL family, nitrate/nitrite response regulator NarL